PNRADDESGPHAARPPATAPQLVPGQGRDLQRRCRGLEQQDSSGDQKVLRLSDLRCYGNSLVSHARPTSRAGINPQILLTRLKYLPSRNMAPCLNRMWCASSAVIVLASVSAGAQNLEHAHTALPGRALFPQMTYDADNRF